MTHNILTCFENLPNELVYTIFDYIDSLELYRAFYNLNLHINTILNVIPNLSFELRSSIDANDPLIKQFSKRVIYLKIYRPDYFDPVQFSNVKSLEFYDFLPQEKLIQVRHKYFTHLVSLRMGYIQDSTIGLIFIQMIFSNGFPSLTKCILDEIIPPDMNHQWLTSPSLRALIIGGFSLTIYSLILNSCPNLIYLHWSSIRYTEENIQSLPVRHIHLKYLYIRTINIRYIETILFHVPYLKRLHIVSDWSHGNNCLPLDFQQLGYILIQRVPHLHHFDCETMERNPINTDFIRRFHPCFKHIKYDRIADGRTRFFTMK